MQRLLTQQSISYAVLSLLAVSSISYNTYALQNKLLSPFLLCCSIVYAVYNQICILNQVKIDSFQTGENAFLFFITIYFIVFYKPVFWIICIVLFLGSLFYKMLYSAFLNIQKASNLILGSIIQLFIFAGCYYLYSKNHFLIIETSFQFFSGMLFHTNYSFLQIIIIGTIGILLTLLLFFFKPYLQLFSFGKAYYSANRISFQFIKIVLQVISSAINMFLLVFTGLFNSNGINIVMNISNKSFIFQLLSLILYSQLLLLFYSFFNNIIALLIMFVLTYVGTAISYGRKQIH